jgi:hypothetical protein
LELRIHFKKRKENLGTLILKEDFEKLEDLLRIILEMRRDS